MANTYKLLRNFLRSFTGTSDAVMDEPLISGGRLKTDAEFTGTLEVNLDPENDGVLSHGSPDSGTTVVPLKTEADGTLNVRQTQDPVGYSSGLDLWKHVQEQETLPDIGTTQIITMTGSAINGSDVTIGKELNICARSSNSGNVYFRIDGSSASGPSDSAELLPGETITIKIRNTLNVSVIGTSGDIVELVGA